MTRTRTTWKAGTSGNPKGRPAGTGRIGDYRLLLDPHIPDLLNVLVVKAKGGDLTAMRLVLDRAYPVRDAAVSELMEEMNELRRMIEGRPANGAAPDMAALLQELEELRQMVREKGLMQ